MENNVRKIAKIEDFSISKKDAEFIRTCTCKVTYQREMEIVKSLRRAGAEHQDIFDIYENYNIGTYSEGYKKNKDNHVTVLIDSADASKTEQIKKLLLRNGFNFYRNLCTDVIHFKLPDTDTLKEYDDYSLAYVNQLAIDTEIGTRRDFEDVVRIMAAQNSYHPIKDYFESLKWDGQDHISKLSTYAKDSHEVITYPDGTKRTVFHAYILRFLVGAIAKIYIENAQNPMLVLYGKQDDGKSTFAQWFSPKKEWLKEGPIEPDDKDTMGDMRYKLIWEVGELGSTIRKADRDSLKRVLTQQTITMRNPYDRRPTDKPVVTSFIGTINATDSGFLNDASGSRRFDVVEIDALNWDYSKDIDINQVWAQAYALFQASEPYRLLDVEKEARNAINSLHEQTDPLIETIIEMLEICDPQNMTAKERAKDIQDAVITKGERASKKEIGRALNNLLITKGFTIAKNLKKRDGYDVWFGIKLKDKYFPNANATIVNGETEYVRPTNDKNPDPF